MTHPRPRENSKAGRVPYFVQARLVLGRTPVDEARRSKRDDEVGNRIFLELRGRLAFPLRSYSCDREHSPQILFSPQTASGCVMIAGD